MKLTTKQRDVINALKAKGGEELYFPLVESFGSDTLHELYNKGIVAFEGEANQTTVVLINED